MAARRIPDFSRLIFAFRSPTRAIARDRLPDRIENCFRKITIGIGIDFAIRGDLYQAVNRLREQFLTDAARLLPRICTAGAILIAVLLRAPTIGSGLPYIDYIDEGYVLHQSIDLLNHRSLDTRWYRYPSLPAYLTVATLIAYSPVYRLGHGHGFRRDLPRDRDLHTSEGDDYDLISPPALIVAGRFVAVLLSVMTVVLAGSLACNLAGNRAGQLSLILVATCPALVSRASNVIVDTFATFFALWSLYFCSRLVQEAATGEGGEVTRRAICAGAAAGLVFASKYTVAVVFAAVALTIVALPVSRTGRLRLLMLASVGFCLAATSMAPAVVFKPDAVFREVAAAAHDYGTMTSALGYFGQAVSRFEVGWPLIIAGVAGLLLMLRSENGRALALGWIVFGTLLVGLFIAKPFQPFRNLLPLVPLLCIAAALAFDQALQWAAGRRRAALWKAAIALVIGAIIITSGVSSYQGMQKRISHRDSRIRAVDWLRERVRKSDRVLAIAELAFLPGELNRIGASVQVVPWNDALALLQRKEFDYLITGSFQPRSATSSFTPRAKFGAVASPMKPYLWRTNEERILILSRPPG